MSEEQDGGWIIVKKHKKKIIEKPIKPQKIQIKGGYMMINKQSNSIVNQQFMNDINTRKNIELISRYIKQLRFKKVNIHCLGLGNFTNYLKSHLQMQFLKVCIINQISKQYQYSINIFDPIFNQEQKIIIGQIPATCQQLKNIDNQTSNIIYMPHCDRFLYENVCRYKQQTQNSEIIVIGNSIKQYKQRCLSLNETIPTHFIHFNPIQIKIKDYKQAFNDTYIYYL